MGVRKINIDTICLSSKTIDVAENETFLELTNRVCFYDEPNANKAMLPSEDAEEKAQTLVNMPVVAKYRVNGKNEPTFGSHEMYIDEDGDVCFGTENIGTHTEIYIEDDTVDVNGVLKTLPCLFAKYRIWKRNKNVVAAIKRLYSEGKLYSSWEIATSGYEFKDGVKKITDYTFLGNCLLGYEYSFPAYGKDAKAISLSAKENQLLIAEALSHDLIEGSNINTTEKEDNQLAKVKKTSTSKEVNVDTKNVNVDESTVDSVNSVDKDTESAVETEASALTEWDLRTKIREACKKKLNTWCYIAFHFPIDKTIWVEKEGRESELDYILFTYEVENDEVTVSEPQDVKLTVGIAEINEKITELQSDIDAKTDALVNASEEIQDLKTQIIELSPFKEKFEEAEQKRIENENAEKRQAMIEKFTKTGYITKKECETSTEIKNLIDTLDEKGLKEIVATRLIEAQEKKDTKTSVKPEIGVEKADLLSEEDVIDTKTIIKKYIGGN